MIEILPYNRELLLSWKYDGVERKLFNPEQMIPMVEYYNRLGKCFIGVSDGNVLGVGGMFPLWDGAGSVWLFLNKGAKLYKKTVFKILLRYMHNFALEYKLKIVIVECIDDSIEAHRLIQHLGFVKNRQVKMTLYVKKVER